MKKRLIFCFASVIAALLLVCTVAGAARADAMQPSVTAAQWGEKGYTVIPLSGTSTDTNHGTSLQYQGFQVLAKDVTYIKESASNGIARNENTFTLSSVNI